MPYTHPQIDRTQLATSYWSSLLVGKKLGWGHEDDTFATRDLPGQHRIVRFGEAVTEDWEPKRLNVHLDQGEKVERVSFG